MNGNKEDILIALTLLAIASVLSVLIVLIVPEVLATERLAVIEIHLELGFSNLPKTVL